MLGLYIHIPFCAKKCPYCDFNTYAGLQSRYAATVDALCTEMTRWRQPLSGRPVTSVFIGGGTPTVLDGPLLSQLLAAVEGNFALVPGCELTCEANPGTVDRAQFGLLRALGVNRLSLGVQSLQPDELRFLGRIHDVEDVTRAVEAARAAGFDNINLDLIFGLPDQSAERWSATLDGALALAPQHLSLYSLIVEPGTPLHHWVSSGAVAAPDEDCAALLYELALAKLGEAGYLHYEVSNWARQETAGTDLLVPAFACRHNLVYWHNDEYLGIGPGAHSHLRLQDEAGLVERRWANCKPVGEYIRHVRGGADPAAFEERIGLRTSMGETMMLGLRLVREGVALCEFQRRYGTRLNDVFASELERLHTWGLIELDRERVRLTPSGLMMGNRVFMEFLPSAEAEPALTAAA